MWEGDGSAGGGDGGGAGGGGSTGGSGGTGTASPGHSGGGSGGGNSGGSGGSGDGQQGTQGVNEDRIVDKLWDRTKKLFGGLIGDGTLEVDDTGEGGEGEQHQHQSAHQVEDDTERKVREILGRVRDEDDHKKDHETVKALLEASPVQQSRTYRALFGAGKR